MSITADTLVQVLLKEGDDRRRRTFTGSDIAISEIAWNRQDLTSGTTAELPITTAFATDTGTKILYLETDKRLRLQFLTRNGAATDLTTATLKYGNEVPANGCYFAYLTNTTHIWLTNHGTGTAMIHSIVLET